MEAAETILEGDEFFRCERYHCTLKKSVCIERQVAVNQREVRPGKVSEWAKYQACQGCEQGAEILAETGKSKEEIKLTIKPMCTDCGERPANINPKTGRVVNGKCGHCMSKLMSEAAKKMKKTKTCKIEGCEKLVVARGVCGPHYDKWRRGESTLVDLLGEFKSVSPQVSVAMKKRKPETAKQDEVPDEVIELTSLELPVGHYPEIIEGLEQAAVVNIRTIEHQALAYIVKGLKADGYGKDNAGAQ